MDPRKLVEQYFLCYSVVIIRKLLKKSIEDLPSMADADNMVNITQCEFQELVGQDTGCVCKAK